MEVPPVRTYVNVMMISKDAPVLESAELTEDGITVEFSKFVDVSTVDENTLILTDFDGEYTITPVLVNEGDIYADTFVLEGDFTNAPISVSNTDGIISYADVAAESGSVDIAGNITPGTETTTELPATTTSTTETTTSTTTETTTESTTETTTTTTAQSTTTTTTESTTTTTETTTEPPATTTTTWYASEEDYCDWAINDYADKTGVTPADAETTENEDGTLSITLTDENGEVLDTYVIDPVTGKGASSDGTEVNLPQTGITSPGTAAVAVGSVFMIVIGTALVYTSRKRREDETN